MQQLVRYMLKPNPFCQVSVSSIFKSTLCPMAVSYNLPGGWPGTGTHPNGIGCWFLNGKPVKAVTFALHCEPPSPSSWELWSCTHRSTDGSPLSLHRRLALHVSVFSPSCSAVMSLLSDSLCPRLHVGRLFLCSCGIENVRHTER